MDKDEIKKILPHREPMLLVDRAEISPDGKTCVGEVTITGEEWFLQGHFPDNPVVPGVIQCEMMAQACCVLLKDELAAGKTPYFTGMDKIKFRKMVKPGDTLVTEAALTKARPPFYFASVRASVGDETAAQGELSFVIK
ncbi:MAG: 3-hydroxyacyl-ACP dehydratase FabZ [Clostridiales bacterium]|jgi:3-hydroxyacyl-[acyl-carrier-protein] dehydratase|nr:3-hydroxyacyl-ACP dehydratase FabZ [Clostridiales bacterium]